MAKRRRHGEGSVYQRKDGTWLGVADFGYRYGTDGKKRRIRKTITAPTEREATRKLRKLISDHERGVIPTTVTLADWADYWLTHADLKLKTRVGYGQLIRNHLNPSVGHVQLAKLSPEDVRRLHKDLADKGLAPASIRQVHAILQRALRVAMGEDKVSRNVAQIVGGPPTPKRPHKTLTADEAMQVLKAAKDDVRLRARLAVALMAGLRQGEALGLKWSDVRIQGDTGTLMVHETVQQITGHGLLTGTPKTARSVRTVPLVDVVALALSAWREASGGTGYVFHGHRGPEVPEGPRRDWQAWKDALAAAGVDHVPLHGARGSVATILQAKGVSPRVIADILGHANVTVTAEHYLHSDAAQQDAALRAAFGEWRAQLEA